MTSRVPRIAPRALALATATFGVGIVVVAVGGEYGQTQTQDDLVLLATVTGIAGMGTVGAVPNADRRAARRGVGRA